MGLTSHCPRGPGTAHDLAAGQGAAVIEDVLAGAMAEGYLLAAAAAADILGEIGSVDLLARGGATPSVLARAAAHSDRRLRFAATGAIMKINPDQPFAGSSAVTEDLVYFAGSYGTPRALVAHPLSAEGQKLVGILAALGYQADVAATGKQPTRWP